MTDQAKREAVYDALLERFQPPDHLTPDIDNDTIGRYALVERNARDRGEHAITTHDSMEDASREHGSQEYPEDWPAIELIDLDTGERFFPVPSLSFQSYEGLVDDWKVEVS